ncbi:hypothetical protein FNV43_RR14866 [Rhamnella rubrinervis]|uniref:Uncharacterized protein n=1 Tax=Rhamnella rubrinervis TaxID=2594499 RepID=A0A8K0H3L0_9ROSA|nr:hypothetical protein FNV43_RR14866 [Rhamnella rubrinervis]
MATTRLLRASKPLNFLGSSSSSSSPAATTFRCLSKGGLNGEKRLSWTGRGEERKPTATAVKASMASSESVITSEPQVRMMRGILDLVCVVRNANHAALLLLRKIFKKKSLRQRLQMIIERIIIDCRFFTLFAVGGSLIGSVLCFVEGCFTILESYFQYFHALSQKSDQGHHVVQLLIEAIGDMSLSLLVRFD